MLRILDVNPSFRPAYSYGGPIESGYELCRHLAEAGADVRVLTTNSNGIGRVTDVPTGIEVAMGPRFTVRYCRKIARHSISAELIRLLDGYVRWADVVHLTGVYNFPTFPTLIACRIHKKPLLWSPRGALQDWSNFRRKQLKIAWCRIAQKAAPDDFVLHVTSELEKVQSADFITARNFAVVPNGIVIPPVLNQVPSTGVLRLAYIGRLDRKKGIENLLDACGRLARENFAFTLRVAGAGTADYTEALRRRARALGIDGLVEFAGDLRDDAKRALFENADVLVVPSYVENFGIVVAEGLAHRIPVIASEGTPWAEMEKIGCGLWIDNDPDSLTAAIRRISALPMVEMGARGRSWMEREFSWTIMASRMIDCMTEMVAR